MDGVPEANALDAGEEGEALSVFRFRQNQDGADLRDGFRENRRRQNRVAIGRVREVALVARHVLDADNTLVELELRHAIDEQERVAVRQNPFDRGVVEGQGQVHVNKRLYLQMSCGQSEPALYSTRTGCPRERYRGADGAVCARTGGHVRPRPRGAAAEDPRAHFAPDAFSGVRGVPARSRSATSSRSRTRSGIPRGGAYAARESGAGPGRRRRRSGPPAARQRRARRSAVRGSRARARTPSSWCRCGEKVV